MTMEAKTLITAALGGAGAGLVVGAAGRFKLIPQTMLNNPVELGLVAGGVMGLTGIAAYSLGKSEMWQGFGAGALGAAGFIVLGSLVFSGMQAANAANTVQATPSTAPTARYKGVAFSTAQNQWYALIDPGVAGPNGVTYAGIPANYRQIAIPGYNLPGTQPTDAVAQAAIGSSGVMLVAGNLAYHAAGGNIDPRLQQVSHGNLALGPQATGAQSATLRMMEAGRQNQMAWQVAARQRAATPPGLAHGHAFRRAGISG